MANTSHPSSNVSEPAHSDTAPRGLPRLLFIAILAAVVGLFLLARGPVWRDPWNADLFDSAIFWSYLPIPVLVGAGLLFFKRFSWRFLFLESLAITLLKYGITFSIAIALWASKGPPAKPTTAASAPRPTPVESPLPPPTPIAKENTGAVFGMVKFPSKEAVPSALVYISAGLETFVFAPPTEPLKIENDGRKVHMQAPPPHWPAHVVTVRTGQKLLGRSLDAHLHTLVATGGSSGTTFNVPMMSSGAWSEVILREPARPSRLRCTVHPDAEEPAYLVVLDHPYFTATDTTGAFKIEGIPSKKITLTTWHPTFGETSSDVTVTNGGNTAVDLTIPQPTP
ncbi:MAG: carboxypeptidase regulatory-like domain-containing protein [Polyangiaceae bacterium]|nr:carboxypeptidase regulatory-like domain-containing protein [Polyangiaceae bacterium]